jgi:carbon storage regulator CsrA
MLTLKRAAGQTLLLGEHVRVTVEKIDRDKLGRRQCHFLIEAPDSIRVIPVDGPRQILEAHVPLGCIEELAAYRRPGTIDRHALVRRAGQVILIGHNVIVRVNDFRHGGARIGIDVPRGVRIHREEMVSNLAASEAAVA